MEKAVLIGIDTGYGDEAELSIKELELLAETAGAETVGTMLQKRDTPDPAAYLGHGKLEEIRDFCKSNEVDLIIVDDELTGTQSKNLENITDVRVIDRTMLILDIFAARAESSQGRLQVELAQLKYRLPRLIGMGKSLSRIGGTGGGGGIATKGPGETKLETDKRHIKRRIYALEEALKENEKRRKISGSKRSKEGIPVCAFIGYTNAGKSTLMNALCGSDVYVEDKLFATLDPTVRRMTADDDYKSDILLVDTVGFIRKLPHTLVEAFKSTLDESLNADLLLHIVDGSDKEAQRHIEIVESILKELGAENNRQFLVLNKSDKVGTPEPDSSVIQKRTHDNVFVVSAKTGEGIEELRQAIRENFNHLKTYNLLVPYSDGHILKLLYDNSKIIETEHTDSGTRLTVTADFSDSLFSKLEKYTV